MSKRPLFSLLASVLISYALAFFLPVKAVWVAAACGLIFAIVFAFFCKVRRFAGLVFLPSALALINFALFYHIAYQPMLRFEGKEIEIQGKIIDERVEGATSDYFRIRPTVLFCEDESYEPMGDVIVYFEADSMSYDVGSTVSFFGTAFKNDEEDFLLNYRVTAREFLSMYATESNLLKNSHPADPYALTASARRKITSIYDAVFSSDVSALINGITLGQTEDIDAELYRNFKDSGISHALSVSGMHLAFVTAILWFVLSLLCKNLYVRSALQIVLIWLFTALTGFASSCCRAAIMLTVFQAGVFVKRESDPLTALSFAMFTCCIRNPFAVMNPSLLLSGTATFGILALTEKIGSLFPQIFHGRGLLSWAYSFIKNTISMSVAATIGTLPVMLLIFQSVSLLAPITNVLVALVIELLFFIGFFAIMLGWIPPVGDLLAWVGKALYSYCDAVTALMSRFPFCTVSSEGYYFWVVLLSTCLVAVLLWVLLRRKHLYILSLCYISMFVSLLGIGYLGDYWNREKVWVDFASVGQGNAVIVSQNHTAVIFDCGGSGLGYREISRCLSRRGVRSISTIYLSHLDFDHTGYLESLMSSYAVNELFLPFREEYEESDEYIFALASMRSTVVRKVERDMKYSKFGLTLDILSGHVDQQSESENENSLVYRLCYGPTEILLVGDLESIGEKRFVRKYGDWIESDILMVGHHGSDGASSQEFLECVDADLAVISVGKNNNYGLPSPKALKRIKKQTPIIKRTDLDGTISICMSPESYEIEGMK